MTRRLFPLAFLAGTLLLASCGGGGGSITGKGPEPEPDRPPIASAITDSGRIYTDIENIDSGEQIYLTYGLWNEPAAVTRSLRADILSRNDEVNPNYGHHEK